MIIDKTIVSSIENNSRNPIPEELKQYLLVKYANEPFPYEYSEQDLYTNIQTDIDAYECDSLDVTIKPLSEQWQEEREFLQQLYFEKSCETRELLDYITELEHILSVHNIKSGKMMERELIY